MTDEWPNVCVLCAARDRQTRLKFGHVCAACTDRLARDLRSIPELAAMAAAWMVPGSATGNGSRSVPSSKPPCNVEALDPALTPVPGHDAVLLVLLEEWERMIRDMRGMTPYGPASASRAQGAAGDTTATLTGVTAFLSAQVEWIVSEPGFPVDDFAVEVRACARVLGRWDADAAAVTSWAVSCPTLRDDDTDCGYRLHVTGDDIDDTVTCRRCRSVWPVGWLMRVAAASRQGHMWLDEEAMCQRFGVDRKTLQRWVREERIDRKGNQYDAKPLVEAMTVQHHA